MSLADFGKWSNSTVSNFLGIVLVNGIRHYDNMHGRYVSSFFFLDIMLCNTWNWYFWCLNAWYSHKPHVGCSTGMKRGVWQGADTPGTENPFLWVVSSKFGVVMAYSTIQPLTIIQLLPAPAWSLCDIRLFCIMMHDGFKNICVTNNWKQSSWVKLLKSNWKHPTQSKLHCSQSICWVTVAKNIIHREAQQKIWNVHIQRISASHSTELFITQ